MKILILTLLLFTRIFAQSQYFIEKDGYIEIEAELFNEQRNSDLRIWQIIDEFYKQQYGNDPDSLEYLTASNNKFVELLPDTRVTHDDEFLRGINFSEKPGLSILEYNVKFQLTGKYYVWVRAFSTGSEDNGIHVGIDGTWPKSGKRMQWCDGKNKWTWESKQRTESNHCGEPKKIYLEIEEPGVHKIQFSMREDGFAFDKFVLSQKYERPCN